MVRDQYLTIRDVAAMLGVNHKTVRREIDSGRLPALRVGRVFRISILAIEANLGHTPEVMKSTSHRGSGGRRAASRREFSQLAREVLLPSSEEGRPPER